MLKSNGTSTPNVPSVDEWIKWGRLNQEFPDDYPLIPDSSLPESSIGLEEVVPKHIETSLPRLPWGSHKALIITLYSDVEPLENLIQEREQVHAALSEAGFEAVMIDANESDNPNEFHKQLSKDHWDILHFIGHMNGKENQIGLSGKLSAADFVASCCRSAPPRLVVLNACRSGDTSAETEVAGISGPIAEQFCLRGVDAVIATRWDIWDQASASFSKKFWPNLFESFSEFNIEQDIKLDVKSSLLETRKYLKSLYSEQDACWLAYTLFTSRNDGCIIPSNQVQGFPIEESHPPFIELENHVMICEYLAPGGAGLYVMKSPPCTGKTTTARLVLRTLGIHQHHLCFISLRHDDSMMIINKLHMALYELDKAPFHPLILDDAELLMNHVHSGIHEKLFQISKRVPLLLIMRETAEQQNFNILPFLQINHNSDELMTFRPHLPSPERFHDYLAKWGFKINIDDTKLLLTRMQGRLYNLPLFFKDASTGNIDYDLLEYPSDAPFQNRLDSITQDELLALQMISKMPTPIISKIRAEMAWTLLHDDGYVSSPETIFKTLTFLGIAQEYHSLEHLPSVSDVDDEFISKIPETFRKCFTPTKEDLEFLESVYPGQSGDDMGGIPYFVHTLYQGYTVNHNAIALVKAIPDHPDLILARRACVSAFKAVNLDCMPRLSDGYDEPEMLLKMAQQRLPHERIKLDSKTLISELIAGANPQGNTLDEALEKWFKNPSQFREAIVGNDSIVYVHMFQRIPSLRPETIHSFGKFVLENRDVFPFSEPRSAYFVWKLIQNGASDVPRSWKGNHASFWSENRWDEIRFEIETQLSKHTEYEHKMQVSKSLLKSTFLLRNLTHAEREEKLLIASKQAIEIDTIDYLEMYLMHLNYCQVLYRHLLLKGSIDILDAFQAHLDASEALISEDEEPNSLLKKKLQIGIPQRMWMHIAFTLLKQRVELRKENDAVQELRWVRDLIEAGHQIGQISPELRRSAISEAGSRLLGFTRRKKLEWTPDLIKIRARLTRQLRERVHSDRLADDTLQVNRELHTHFIYSFDPQNPLPPILRGQMEPPHPSKETKRKWYEAMDEIVHQYEGFPDSPLDISWILQKTDASNIEMDNILGPLTGEGTSRVATVMWRGTIRLGEAARIVGAFASTYPEHLTPEEKLAADLFQF